MGTVSSISAVILLTALFACSPAGCSNSGKVSSQPDTVDIPPVIVLPTCYSSPGPPVPGELSWEAPLWPIDCSPIGSVAGYRVYYGSASGTFTGSVDVGKVTSVSLATLSSAVSASGSYYLVVTAYDEGGMESAYSNEVKKDL